jgi:hypothetical protein
MFTSTHLHEPNIQKLCCLSLNQGPLHLTKTCKVAKKIKLLSLSVMYAFYHFNWISFFKLKTKHTINHVTTILFHAFHNWINFQFPYLYNCLYLKRQTILIS